MKIDSIRFDGEDPHEVTLTMSALDLARLVRHFGDLAPDRISGAGPRLYVLGAALVFQPYYDHGVDVNRPQGHNWDCGCPRCGSPKEGK